MAGVADGAGTGVDAPLAPSACPRDVAIADHRVRGGDDAGLGSPCDSKVRHDAQL